MDGLTKQRSRTHQQNFQNFNSSFHGGSFYENGCLTQMVSWILILPLLRFGTLRSALMIFRQLSVTVNTFIILFLTRMNYNGQCSNLLLKIKSKTKKLGFIRTKRRNL